MGWLSRIFGWFAPAIAGALDIGYVDADGRCSERYIEAKSLSERNGKLYLYGWCEQGQGVRSFRVDRIQALTDGETGEIISPENIRPWLIGRTRQ